MLIGDSIRRSYQPLVTDLLHGRAEVVGPTENCQFSEYTLARLDDWLKELGKPDIVHWNNGLHDVGYNPNRAPVQYSLDTYLDNLKLIITKLRKIDAKIIWATTTPVHPKRQFVTMKWSWRNADIDRYNMAARKLMKAEDIRVNDLHKIVVSKPDISLTDDMIHLSKMGVEYCAKAVVKAIEVVM